MRPRFLQALDNVDATDNGYLADCPICRDILLIDPGNHQNLWTLACDGGCTHDELVRWLQITELRIDPDWETRMWVALMLAPTPEIWHALRAGAPVNEESLHQDWLQRFRKFGVV